MKKLIILLFCMAAVHAEQMTVRLNDDGADYGCGPRRSVVHYCPRGLGEIGCFVGHANPLTREDVTLMRFDIGRLYLLDRTPEIKSAWLEFFPCYKTRGADKHRIIIEHLGYERDAFLADDMSSSNAEEIGLFPISVRQYRIDITDCLRRDLKARRLHSSFRFSATCGGVKNDTGGPVGCTIMPPYGKDTTHIPFLSIEFK